MAREMSAFGPAISDPDRSPCGIARQQPELAGVLVPSGRTMARDYFRVLKGSRSVIEDPDGSDLPDLQAAHAEAVSAIREMLAEALRWGREPVGHSLVIADSQGQQLEIVRFVDILPKTLI